MTRLFTVACLAMLLAAGSTSGARAADEAELEAVYGRYHQAIEAARVCRKLDFDQAAHSKMAGVIHQRIQHRIGAKRLSLLTAAQGEARDLIDKEGCKGASVEALLGLFDKELAPALN